MLKLVSCSWKPFLSTERDQTKWNQNQKLQKEVSFRKRNSIFFSIMVKPIIETTKRWAWLVSLVLSAAGFKTAPVFAISTWRPDCKPVLPVKCHQHPAPKQPPWKTKKNKNWSGQENSYFWNLQTVSESPVSLACTFLGSMSSRQNSINTGPFFSFGD